MKIQQPCEDAVSRAKAIEICKKHGHDNSAHYISELPPVTPTRKKGKWVAHHDKSDWLSERKEGKNDSNQRNENAREMWKM